MSLGLSIKFFAASVTICSCWAATTVFAQPTEGLDARCKAEVLPPGYVAVGELESPECPTSTPPAKNAWYIDKLRDGIVSCKRIDYENDYAPLVGYIVCDTEASENCPSRFDGSDNAFKLTLTKSCDRFSFEGCIAPLAWDEKLKFSDGERHFPTRQLVVIDAIENSPSCVGHQECFRHGSLNPVCQPASTSIKRSQIRGNVPVCIAHNWPLIHHLNALNSEPNNERPILVKRIFKTSGCPEGGFGDYNAMILERAPSEWKGVKLFTCSPALRRRSFVDDIAWIWLFNNKASEPIGGRFEVLEEFQDERCGDDWEKTKNAFTLRFQ
ncbi:hypothetical protein [Rhizobium johnstonii]|uniref:hypothetical protein n=1 Tax=Rhizobium johnstonii TaxID=3019933 RepID=UPI003F95AB73